MPTIENMTDDDILASGIAGKRSHVLPEERLPSNDRAVVSEDPLMGSMDAEPVYQIQEPKVESLIVQDKIARDSSPDDQGFWNQFYGSLESTIFQDNPRLSGRAIEGLGRASGIDSMRELGENIVAEFDASPPEEKFVPRVSNYKDVDGLNAALDYVGSTVGQGVGSIAMTVGGGLVGAGAGAAVGSVVPGAGTVTGAVVGGATVGGVGGSFLLNYGDTYEYMMETEGMDPEDAALYAIVPGTIMAGLDAYGVGRLLGPAKGELASNIIKRTGQLALRGAGTEGVTESAQQVIQEFSGELAEAAGYATADIEFAQRFDNVINSMIAGALTGGAMGGATSPFKKPTEAPPPGDVETAPVETAPVEAIPEAVETQGFDTIEDYEGLDPEDLMMERRQDYYEGIADLQGDPLDLERLTTFPPAPADLQLELEELARFEGLKTIPEAMERKAEIESDFGSIEAYEAQRERERSVEIDQPDQTLEPQKYELHSFDPDYTPPSMSKDNSKPLSRSEYNSLREQLDINRNDPRFSYGGEIINGFPEGHRYAEKRINQPNLMENPDFDQSATKVYSETGLKGFRALIGRTEAGPRSHVDFWASDDIDLAIGQGGRGYMLEIDPRLVNGFQADTKGPMMEFQAAGILKGSEYKITQSVRGAVTALIFRNPKQIQAVLRGAGQPGRSNNLATYLSNAFDFENPIEFEFMRQGKSKPVKGFRVPRKTQRLLPAETTEATTQAMVRRRQELRKEYGFNEAEAIITSVMTDAEVEQYIQDQPVFRAEGIGELSPYVRLPEGYEADPYDGPLYSKIDPSRSFPGPAERPAEASARSVPTETAETTEAAETAGGVVEEAGRFEVNMAQMAARLGQSMYAGELSQVVIKEGIQNSFDAIKAMQSKGVGSSQIHIIVNDDARTIEIVDDGSGMTLDIVKKAFLTLGGTHKEDTSAENSSGGHGMAKMAFLLGPERFQLDTVRDGKRILIDATPLEIMNNDFKIKIEDGQPAGTRRRSAHAVREMGEVEGHGTKITVKIPKTYTNPRTGEQESVSMPYTFSGFLTEPLIGDVEVRYSVANTNYDSDYNPTGVTVDPPTILDMGRNLDLSTYNKYTTVEFDWGRADLYIENDRARYPTAKILSSGLFQFEAAYKLGLSRGGGFPYNIIVDIKPSVRSGESPLYPFNNSREDFSAPIKEDVKALGQYILSIGNARDAEATAATFANAVSMERIGMEDVGGSFADARKAMLDSFADERREADVAALEMEQEQQEISVTRIDPNLKKIIEIMRDGSKREKDYGKPKLEADKKPSMVAKEILDTGRRGEGFGDLDPSKPLFHNNTNVDYIAALNELPESERPTSVEEFFTELGSIVVEFREVCAESLSKSGGSAYKELNNPEATYASGISIDKDYHGVHVRAPYRAFFLNPLPMSVYRVTHPYSAMESTLHTLLHEVTHVTKGRHNESFTSEIFENYTRLAESGHMEAFRNALKEVYGKHWKTFNSLRKIYGKHSTRNIGKSLEGSESRVRQGQGTVGVDGESVGDSPDVVSAEGYGQSNIGRSTPDSPGPTRGSTEVGSILASRVVEGLQKKKVSEPPAAADVKMWGKGDEPSYYKDDAFVRSIPVTGRTWDASDGDTWYQIEIDGESRWIDNRDLDKASSERPPNDSNTGPVGVDGAQGGIAITAGLYRSSQLVGGLSVFEGGVK